MPGTCCALAELTTLALARMLCTRLRDMSGDEHGALATMCKLLSFASIILAVSV